MRRSPRLLTTSLALVLIVCLSLVQVGRSAAQTAPSTITGTFVVEEDNPTEQYYLWETSTSSYVRLAVTAATLRAAGGPIALNHRTVTVTGIRSTPANPAGGPPHATQESISVQTLSPVGGAAAQATAAVTGNTRWLNLLCKFSDISAEPHPPSYYQNLFQQYAFPGLDSYWQEQSYGAINLANSITDSQWHTLPHPVSYYRDASPQQPQHWNSAALWSDCVSVANEGVNLFNYYGVSLTFNNTSDPVYKSTAFAYIGPQPQTYNGTQGIWGQAYFPNAYYQYQGGYAHEFGHTYGFHHSSNTIDLAEYHDNWDAMGNQWASSITDATYGNVAMGTIAYDRALNGWLPTSRIYTYSSGNVSVDLGQLDSAVAGTYSMVKIPINGSSTHYYTVEYRINNGLLNAGQSYDNGLPTNSVLIFEVDTQGAARCIGPDGVSPGSCIAYLVGAAGGDGNNTYSPYFEWTAGESFTTPNNIQISITALNAGDALVTVSGGTQAAVTATDAWTNDGGSDWSVHKTVFNPGDPVRYVGAVNNPGTGATAATMAWSVTGSAGQIAAWSSIITTGPGTNWWGLPRTIPTNACSAGSSASAEVSGGGPPESVRPGTPGTPIAPASSGNSAGDAVWDADPVSAASAAACTYTFQFSVTFGGATTTKSFTFQVQPAVTAPGTPTLTAPPEGATDVGTTPTISWTAPSGAVAGSTQYTAYLWDPAASVMKFQQTTTALSVGVPQSAGLVGGHFYYMSVQACNGSACGPLARWEGFTTKSIGAPGLTSPAEGATGVSQTPTLSWTAASGATASTQYTAYIWDPSVNAVAFQATTAGLSVSVPAAQALQALHFYYYSAVACDGGSCGPLARWEGFTTKSSGPTLGAPGLTAPPEGATNVSRTPTLQWTAPSGSISGTTQYTAYIWDPTASAMAWQGTTTQLSITVPSGSPLAAGHFFYYSAQACNGATCGPLARWEGFTTTGGLVAPVLIAPREGATGVGTTPTFQWGAVTGNGSTVFYTLYVWDPQASVMKFQQTTALLSLTVPGGSALTSGRFYYFSVQACDSSGCGPLARWEGFTS